MDGLMDYRHLLLDLIMDRHRATASLSPNPTARSFFKKRNSSGLVNLPFLLILRTAYIILMFPVCSHNLFILCGLL